MSAITTRLEGDDQQLMRRLRSLSEIDKRGVLNAIAEGLRTSTEERFQTERDPEGNRWEPSVRARDSGGKTLTKTAHLKTSIKATVDSHGIAVGTNDIRAATLQFGDERTIRANRSKYLVFQVGGKWRRAKSVTIRIPARPFLGISEEDKREIRDIMEAAIEGES